MARTSGACLTDRWPENASLVKGAGTFSAVEKDRPCRSNGEQELVAQHCYGKRHRRQR